MSTPNQNQVRTLVKSLLINQELSSQGQRDSEEIRFIRSLLIRRSFSEDVGPFMESPVPVYILHPASTKDIDRWAEDAEDWITTFPWYRKQIETLCLLARTQTGEQILESVAVDKSTKYLSCLQNLYAASTSLLSFVYPNYNLKDAIRPNIHSTTEFLKPLQMAAVVSPLVLLSGPRFVGNGRASFPKMQAWYKKNTRGLRFQHTPAGRHLETAFWEGIVHLAVHGVTSIQQVLDIFDRGYETAKGLQLLASLQPRSSLPPDNTQNNQPCSPPRNSPATTLHTSPLPQGGDESNSIDEQRPIEREHAQDMSNSLDDLFRSVASKLSKMKLSHFFLRLPTVDGTYEYMSYKVLYQLPAMSDDRRLVKHVIKTHNPQKNMFKILDHTTSLKEFEMRWTEEDVLPLVILPNPHGLPIATWSSDYISNFFDLDDEIEVQDMTCRTELDDTLLHKRATIKEFISSTEKREHILSSCALGGGPSVFTKYLDIIAHQSTTWRTTSDAFSQAFHEDEPCHIYSWMHAAHAGATSRMHMNPNGFCTAVDVLCGTKLLAVPQLSSGTAWPLDELEWTLNFQLSFNWSYVVLPPGSHVYMKPGTPHVILTLEDSITSGGHFLSRSTLASTMSARRVPHKLGTTTSEDHEEIEAIVARMLSHAIMVKDTQYRYMPKDIGALYIMNKYPEYFTLAKSCDFDQVARLRGVMQHVTRLVFDGLDDSTKDFILNWERNTLH